MTANDHAQPIMPALFDPAKELGFQPNGIVSRVIVQNEHGGLTFFAFDAGQELSEHTAPFHALATVLEGRIEFRVGGKVFDAKPSSCVLMPAGIPHALRALDRSKMLLLMIRAG